ncbi:MAG: type IV toxin-antitoxin system AbiEi family antitoxin domain-containing protein [Rhodoglobus sp.]
MTGTPLNRQQALLRTRDVDAVAAASTVIRSAVRRRTLTKLHRGVYLPTDYWDELDADERYRARIQAAVMGFPSRPVVSHQSAAAWWGIPIIGRWPDEVHLLVDRATGGRSDPGVRRHALGVSEEDFVELDGIRVTSLARTVVDLAASTSLYSAVATADAAIRTPRFGAALLAKEDLYREWERMMPFRGSAKALRVIDFAEDGADSTSESTSRVSVALLGFPAPVLQREFVVNGEPAWADFYFPHVDAIGECDGLEKYVNVKLRGGRSLEEVLLREKKREDALRRQVSAFERWGSREAMTPRLLRPKLLALGLTPGAPRIRVR